MADKIIELGGVGDVQPDGSRPAGQYTVDPKVRIRWPVAAGKLPAALDAKNGEGTSTLDATDGSLILKRCLLDVDGLKALMAQAAHVTILTVEEAALLLPVEEEKL